MEIERKFTLKSLPDNLESYPSHHIEQVYLNYNPVVRARKQDDEYYLTYKGSGMMARDESNLPLNEVSYYHLREKADGSVISKRRYLIPLQHPGFKEGFPTPPADYSLTIELDVFDAPFAPLIMAEVEFGSKEAAEAFVPPAWFDKDVTYCKEYLKCKYNDVRRKAHVKMHGNFHWESRAFCFSVYTTVKQRMLSFNCPAEAASFSTA